ncbi:MAG TPA: Gfo/Idh/MocA family oxidoreductase [Verrucomicrobiae bacterium]|nr:Gfo/Idh/MocA family oxidoreductase [Verrucomicrobiae bacterium]
MRLAIVGLGIQGRKRRAIAGERVVATVDPLVPDADFKTIQEVPSASYDAVCVCVPDQVKVPLLQYLLARGKHVLVEKPLLAPPEEIRDLINVARTNRAACYTAYNHRFEPHIARLKQILDANGLGPLYLARIFYGNGTARDVRNSPWRDQGMGVLSDLGSHLLDTALFLFGPGHSSVSVWAVNRFENRAPDHVLFGHHGQPALEMEATFLSWRNTFYLDVYGELGSAHIQCLCKWGPSTLTVRKRVFPSGRPEESVETLEQPDPTWKFEFEHFLHLCKSGGTNLENDVWIEQRLRQLADSAKLAQA